MRDWTEEINRPPIFGFSFPYSGLGVSVTILDDGIEKDHPDLIRYFFAMSNIAIFHVLNSDFSYLQKKRSFKITFAGTMTPFLQLMSMIMIGTAQCEPFKLFSEWFQLFIEKTQKNSK